ncbi:MAG: hypothetical protein HYV35_08155 [Lentisphaerae bacterium]|nr:hypothetical protein [Lentisphaerota bacterium]
MNLCAGTATIDISPKSPMQLDGYPHVRRVATGTHDPLLASALYLQNGDEAVLLCALDLLMLNGDFARRLRQRAAAAINLPESHVFISCTHTHSAPVTARYLPFGDEAVLRALDPAFLAQIEAQTAQAAEQARAAAQPAELTWRTADARGVGGNRHDPNGPTDSEAGVLGVRSLAGAWLAVAVIYGMHPTVLHEDSTLVSSDFPHYTRLHIREQLGQDVAVLYHTAPCGNQSPRYFVNSQTFAEAERLGRKLGAAVVATLRAAPECAGTPLAGALCPVALYPRHLPAVSTAEKQLARYRAEHEELLVAGAKRPRVRTAEVAVFGAEGTVALVTAAGDGRLARLLADLQPFEVQALRIGEVCLVGLPGELFVEYSFAIKRRAALKTAVVAFVNGELQGYIVTPQAVAAGGYEAAGRLFEPEAGDRLVATALNLVERLAVGAG